MEDIPEVAQQDADVFVAELDELEKAVVKAINFGIDQIPTLIRKHGVGLAYVRAVFVRIDATKAAMKKEKARCGSDDETFLNGWTQVNSNHTYLQESANLIEQAEATLLSSETKANEQSEMEALKAEIRNGLQELQLLLQNDPVNVKKCKKVVAAMVKSVK